MVLGDAGDDLRWELVPADEPHLDTSADDLCDCKEPHEGGEQPKAEERTHAVQTIGAFRTRWKRRKPGSNHLPAVSSPDRKPFVSSLMEAAGIEPAQDSSRRCAPVS